MRRPWWCAPPVVIVRRWSRNSRHLNAVSASGADAGSGDDVGESEQRPPTRRSPSGWDDHRVLGCAWAYGAGAYLSGAGGADLSSSVCFAARRRPREGSGIHNTGPQGRGPRAPRPVALSQSFRPRAPTMMMTKTTVSAWLIC